MQKRECITVHNYVSLQFLHTKKRAILVLVTVVLVYWLKYSNNKMHVDVHDNISHESVGRARISTIWIDR